MSVSMSKIATMCGGAMPFTIPHDGYPYLKRTVDPVKFSDFKPITFIEHSPDIEIVNTIHNNPLSLFSIDIKVTSSISGIGQYDIDIGMFDAADIRLFGRNTASLIGRSKSMALDSSFFRLGFDHFKVNVTATKDIKVELTFVKDGVPHVLCNATLIFPDRIEFILR